MNNKRTQDLLLQVVVDIEKLEIAAAAALQRPQYERFSHRPMSHYATDETLTTSTTPMTTGATTPTSAVISTSTGSCGIAVYACQRELKEFSSEEERLMVTHFVNAVCYFLWKSMLKRA